jgi:hypothetical protein
MIVRARFFALLLSGSISLAAYPAAAQSPTGATAPQAQPAPAPVERTFAYDPEGRRDPFESLLGRGRDPRTSTVRPAGLAGLLVADVTVKGILRDRDGFMAMLQSPDNKTFIVKAGDKLFDGSVKAILQDKVIFSQDVNDPLSLVKQREIPKAVRPADGRGAPPAF